MPQSCTLSIGLEVHKASIAVADAAKDMAKLVFHVVGMDNTDTVVLRKHIARSALLHAIATLPPLRIGMEACRKLIYDCNQRSLITDGRLWL
jgi:hypothetical protein